MVLIINRNKRDAVIFSETFHFMGILSYSATPTEALSEISLLYRAAIIMEPDTLPDPRDFVARLRSYAAIPIFAISDGTIENAGIYDEVYNYRGYSSHFISRIAKKTKSMGLPYIGDYRLAGIDANCDRVGVCYFDKPIGLTKTESMILRFLIRSYPEPMDAAKILKYAFKSARRPEASGVRTHISMINRKFKAITDRNLITLVPGRGYAVLTPEMNPTRRDALTV